MPNIRIDDRRFLMVPGDIDSTIAFAIESWLEIAQQAIDFHGFFSVALSGGSTPKPIFQGLSTKNKSIDWEKVFLFWSDERNVPPTDERSNYHMAMHLAGLERLPIPREHIFRMNAEDDLKINAELYELLILSKLGSDPFDLIMLGLGEDGHTASLFPNSEALKEEKRLVVENYVSQKDEWRMTFTYPCIHHSYNIVAYAFGSGKAQILKNVLSSDATEYPAHKVGTASNPALWIADSDAASLDLFRNC